jgi:peptide/nickel transport system permease protein
MAGSVLARYARSPGGIAGAVVLAVIALAALAAPLVFPGDPLAIAGAPMSPPFTDARHPLGTDRLGRDVLALLAYGARVTLLVSLAATAGALAIGVSIGTLAGYLGGIADEVLMRITEAFQTVPGFILALALVTVMGASVTSIVVAIAASSWTGPARLVRAEILSLRRHDFVDAYRVLGMHPVAIAFREVLPNALPSAVTLASVIVASAILIEAALSFLGIGDPNVATWGSMIAEGRGVLRSAPYLSFIPGVAVAITVIAVNLVGEGVNEALSPRRARP